MLKNDITDKHKVLAEQLQSQPIGQALNSNNQALANRFALANFKKEGKL